MKRIGISEITDRGAISDFYNAVTSMKLENAELNSSPENERFLTVTLRDGTVIADLKYSGDDGRFFQYGQIVYSRLDTDTQAKMKEIFNITAEIPRLSLIETTPGGLLAQTTGIKSADDIRKEPGGYFNIPSRIYGS